MPVAVVQVRIVRMAVAQRPVDVRMRVQFCQQHTRGVSVLVVLEGREELSSAPSRWLSLHHHPRPPVHVAQAHAGATREEEPQLVATGGRRSRSA